MKELFIGPNLSWSYSQDLQYEQPPEGHQRMPFMSHNVLIRPEHIGYPTKASPYFNMVCFALKEILEFNDVKIKGLYRINANLTFPTAPLLPSIPHIDHDFPHENVLIYLNDTGGDTVVDGEHYSPHEDDVITFGGEKHYMYPPDKGGRIVIVATYETFN
tara:strand:- start:1066 stop:1545 length:480 start_codon:yes stop_codon:yes gene_type:complete